MIECQGRISQPRYRPDIDGLRAVAVLAVVAFHAFPDYMKGGFIGVDIFFVISGYLISTIIFESLDKGTFSFAEFYARRVKRIFPALILVLVSCFVLGWFTLLADEFKQLGKHIVAGAAFFSNLVLWHESGYFDNAADTKPLLHLWSLGVEEQFYIAWPLMIWFAYKKRLNLLSVAVLTAVCSFCLNLYQVKTNVIADFYSPQTRFWELMLGSILAWVTLYKPQLSMINAGKINRFIARIFFRDQNEDDGETLTSVVSVFALLLLIYGFWRIDKAMGFPGKWALIPVISSVLLIYAGPKALVNRTILSNKIAVWFGLISFPLYLWHWPLLSFARIIGSEVPSLNIRIFAVAFSIMLGWLTYKFVERPIRLGKNEKYKIIVLVLLMSIIGYLGYYAHERDGLPSRNFPKINPSLSSGYDGGSGVTLINECGISVKDIDIQKKFAMCVTDSRPSLKYALIGDSKAAAIFGGLVRTSSETGRWLFIGGSGPNGAPVPVISDLDLYKQYQQLSRIAINTVASNNRIEKVVLITATRALFQLSNDVDINDLPGSNNYSAALDGLKHAVEILIKAGKKVVLVIDNPTLPHPEDCLYRKTSISLINHFLVKENPKCVLSLDEHLSLSSKYRQLLEEVKSTYPNDVEIFDTTKYLCNEKKRVCTHFRDGRSLYAYSDHISDYAAGLIGRDLNEFLSKK